MVSAGSGGSLLEESRPARTPKQDFLEDLMSESMMLPKTPRFRVGGAAAQVQQLGRTECSRSPRAQVDLEVVIPVYNEEARIAETLQALVAYLEQQRFSSSVVVVDNGCADRTLDRVDALSTSRVPIRVIACANKGKGAAIRRAMVSTQARWIGFCDADLATPIETIGPVTELLEAGHPIVIASRRVAGASIVTTQPVVRRFGGMVFRSLAALVVDGIADTQCGFKFFEAHVAKMLFARSQASGFAFDVEILALARRDGLTVTEVPVAWTDIHGSSLNAFVDGPRAIRELINVRTRLATLPA
jgi:glycosyltransferase involved in cell wall biosynthesis